MIQGEADGSSGLSQGVTGQAKSACTSLKAKTGANLGVCAICSVTMGSGMFWGVERAHRARQSWERWQYWDPRWRGCILLSVCWAEPSAAREAGCEEYTNPPNLRAFLAQEEAWTSAAGPENPGQHFQAVLPARPKGMEQPRRPTSPNTWVTL